MPSISAALIAKLITPSDTMQVTVGTCGEEFNLATRSKNGAKQFFRTESHRAGTSCVASRSEGGSPSGMVLNRKSGRPLTESGPLDLIKRLWLNSVLTKVMWKPLECKSLANCIMGLTWPCDGYGTQTAWGLLVSTEIILRKQRELKN